MSCCTTFDVPLRAIRFENSGKWNIYLPLLTRTFVSLGLLFRGISLSLTHFISQVSFCTLRNHKESLHEKCLNMKLCFPVFNSNAGKYGPEKTPYLDTFHAVEYIFKLSAIALILPKFLDFSHPCYNCIQNIKATINLVVQN